MENKLFVGAKIYEIHNNKIMNIFVIDRITKTQAISSKRSNYAYNTYETKFRIDISNYGYAYLIGSNWCNSSYSLETPKLKELALREVLLNNLKNIEFEKLEINLIKEILSLIENFN